ncbi:hypothetical protein L2E82_30235 [Cichorium intybus]|uniref:Uncharacterized protein n=1 Tax=Cichorium intybus TaxID=13427 RepID=A0ACB9CZN4_CICIN|nr:hypothetical protein L2E82_30235 [Cichorium intybus]
MRTGHIARSSCVTPCVNTSSFFDLQIWSGPISDRQIWWFFRVVFIRSGWGFDLHLSDPFFARPYVRIYGGKQSLASDGDDKEPFSLSSPMVMTKNRYRSSSPSDLRWLTVRRWWMSGGSGSWVMAVFVEACGGKPDFDFYQFSLLNNHKRRVGEKEDFLILKCRPRSRSSFDAKIQIC